MIRLVAWLGVFCAAGLSAGAAELRHLGTYVWEESYEGFGGYSGLTLSEDGSGFMAVSDKGFFTIGSFEREAGQITGIDVSRQGIIPDKEGETPGAFERDAEGIAIAPDGSVYVSFEGNHRVWRFASDFAGKAEAFHAWDHFWFLQQNSGLEALAIDDQERLYVIPERSGKWTRPFPVYRYENGAWSDDLSIPRSKKYLVVGADFGPDGRLYVLERLFEWYGGFSNRVRRFTLDENGFDDGETLLETKLGAFGNLEGISLWKNEDGHLVATLIADDNFNVLQATSVVEFELVE
jgi:hypothetical protein